MQPWEGEDGQPTHEQIETLPLDWKNLKRCHPYRFGSLILEGIFKDPRFQNTSLKANSGKYYNGETWITVNYHNIAGILEEIVYIAEAVFDHVVEMVQTMVTDETKLGRLEKIRKMTAFMDTRRLTQKEKKELIVFRVAEVVKNNPHCLAAEKKFSRAILRDEFEPLTEEQKMKLKPHTYN